MTAYEMRISDWSSDVCSFDLGGGERHRHIFGAGVLREPIPAGAQLEAVLAADDAEIGFAVLRLAGVGNDRDRGGDVQRRERAVHGAVGLRGKVGDSSHDQNSFGCSGTIPEGAHRRGREPSSPERSEGRTQDGVDGIRRSRPAERRQGGLVFGRPMKLPWTAYATPDVE